MLKIAHLQLIPQMSGVQNVSYEILKTLSSQEYDKYIIFSGEFPQSQKNKIEEIFNSIDVKVIFCNHLIREISFNEDIKAFFELCKIFKKYKFDIVHTNSTKTGILGRIAAKISKTKYIIHTVHGTAWNNFISKKKWLFYYFSEMFASFFCDRIVLVNKFYAKYFKCFRKKVQTIYNGIDYSKYNSNNVGKIHNNDIINILYVGRLDFQKDPETLLRAISIIREKENKAYFTIVGDGEYYSMCEDYISANNLSSYVKLVGWCDSPDIYYSQADIFMSSSIYEAFGLVFLEAGYYHLPVCSTNVEGIPEVVFDGKSGLLCNPKDYKKLAENVLKLCEDTSLRKEMGEENYKVAISYFSIDKMKEGYISLYREIWK